MWSNYLKIAIRNLTKNTLFSVINIGGMAISLASFLIIGLFVWDELQFDRDIPDATRTFRVYDIRTGDDGATNYYPIVPVPFATYMQKDFPEIESTVRLCDAYEQLVESGNSKVVEKNGLYAEAGVFDMLGLHVIAGQSKSALEKPNTIALSESFARKYFNSAMPIGETLKIDGAAFVVDAVYSDPGNHVHLAPPYLVSFSTLSSRWQPAAFENWQLQQYFLYLKLKPGSDATALEAKLPGFVEKYAYPKIKSLGFTYVPHLQNIRDIHLHSVNFEWDVAPHGNAQMVYILSVTAIVLLVIACLNFVNLSTARSVRRMREVGVRKVTGAAQRQLILQFLSESVLITMVSLAVAVILCELTFPFLNAFAEKNLSFPSSPLFAGGLISFSVVLGLMAGAYPAFQLSSYRPAIVLYSRTGITGSHGAWFRQGLVVVQFVLSFLLIIGSMIVLAQNNLLQNKDLGFSKDHLISIPLRSAQLHHPEATKNEFSAHPNVISTTIAFGIPGDIAAGDQVIDPSTQKILPSTVYCVDRDYVSTLDMHIVAGRDFSREFPSDEKNAFILNETAVKSFGFGTPESVIGHPLDWHIWGRDSVKKGTVVGVVRDFHFKSLREQVTPVVLQVAPNYTWKIVVRIKSTEIPRTVAFLKNTYERLDPEWAFTYQFVDSSFDRMYRTEEKLSVLFTVFTGLAIVVACLGLFGLVEYSVNQRTKEISIRKVFGASVTSLLMLLTRSYLALVILALVVVIPVSMIVARQWLNTFAYHIEISPWMFVRASALVFLITLTTILFQSLKAARTSPTNALRNE